MSNENLFHTASSIVNHVLETAETPVERRQAINDDLDAYVARRMAAWRFQEVLSRQSENPCASVSRPDFAEFAERWPELLDGADRPDRIDRAMTQMLTVVFGSQDAVLTDALLHAQIQVAQSCLRELVRQWVKYEERMTDRMTRS